MHKVRNIHSEDIPSICQYWTGMDLAALQHMGVDPKKIPTANQISNNLKEIIATPDLELKTSYLIWELDGVAVGFNSLKRIIYGESADMHLHMWAKDLRGGGHGGIFFCLAALEFYRRFKLKHIICEPKAANPMPNRMLQKVGFQITRRYFGSASELSDPSDMNQYFIDPEVARRFLDSTQ